MKSTLSLLVATVISSTAQAWHPDEGKPAFLFEHVPYCDEVWNASNIPDVADPATVAFMNSPYGAYTGAKDANGDIPLQNFIEHLMIVHLHLGGVGLGQPATTPEELACKAFFGTQLGTPVSDSGVPHAIAAFNSDLEKFKTDVYNNPDLDEAWYAVSSTFYNLRLCPCFNRFPREAFEGMNCRMRGAWNSLAENYYYCHAVDVPKIHEPFPTLNAATPTSGTFDWANDRAAIADWKGCETPASAVFSDNERPGCSACGGFANTTYDSTCPCNYKDNWFEVLADAEIITPRTVLPTRAKGDLTGSYLDDIYGMCMPCERRSEQKAVAENSGGFYERDFVHEICSHGGWDVYSTAANEIYTYPKFSYVLSIVPCSQVAAFDILTVEQCNVAANSLAEVPEWNIPRGLTAIQNNGKRRHRNPYGCYFSKDKGTLQLNLDGKERKASANQPVLCAYQQK